MNRIIRPAIAGSLAILVFSANPVFASAASNSRKPTSIPAVDQSTQILSRVRELMKRGELETALKRLEGDWGNQLTQAQSEAAARFAKGRILEALKRDDQAVVEYQKALEKKSAIDAHIRFSLGKTYARLGKSAEAKDALSKVLNGESGDIPAQLKTRAVMELANLIVAAPADGKNQNKQWNEVIRLLQPMMRSTKGQEAYPSYAYLLMKAKRKTGATDCKLARDLYAKYPAAPEVASWGPLLPNNKIDDLKINCSASVKDMQTRLRRLQLAGQIDRSVAEIHDLRAKGIFDAWTTDVFEINAMLANGQNEEASKLLLKHSESEKGRPAFWSLLGKASSRMGDFSASSGAYMKAFNMAPKGKAASDALFNSAFAAYQMQDYDGAEDSFSLLSKRYGRAKVARDARWHLAWMSYLRGDYETALSRWNSLLKERGRRRVVRGDATSPDRIQYWSAMALLRLGKDKQAVELFRSLLRDPSIDYYAILAWYRLKTTPGVTLTDAENRLGRKRIVGEGELKDKIEEETAEAVKDVAKTVTADATAVGAAAADPVTADTSSDAAGDADDAEGGEPEPEIDEVDNTVVVDAGSSSSVRDPALQKRLERVRQLYALGFNEETRWELQTLDSKVRNPLDRRVMMAELHRLGRWDRSSTLGELAFSGQRLRGGLDGARDLWEFTYPKAWNDYVSNSAKAASVDEDLVWSIMRAESHYRADARSPVGASGLMQIMPFTGERISSQLLGRDGFRAADLMDPEINVKLGARYLKRLGDKFANSLPLIAAGYNAGPHRVQTWLRGFGALRMDEFIEHIPFVETRNYVKKVTRNFQIYRLLYRDDRGSLAWLVKPVGVAPESGPGALDVW